MTEVGVAGYGLGRHTLSHGNSRPELETVNKQQPVENSRSATMLLEWSVRLDWGRSSMHKAR